MPAMKFPNERLAILNRIKAIARKNPTFSMDSCIGAYFTMHHTNDWQICLDYLVKEGVLIAEGNEGYSLAHS